MILFPTYTQTINSQNRHTVYNIYFTPFISTGAQCGRRRLWTIRNYKNNNLPVIQKTSIQKYSIFIFERVTFFA